MQLDARIKKLASGMTAREATLARTGAKSGHHGAPHADSPEIDEFAGMVEAMFLMAAVDGVVAEDEVNKLADGIRSLIGPEGVDEATLSRWLAELQAQLESDGWSRRVEVAASKLRSDGARLEAYRLAAAVAMVDDRVEHAEAAAIDAFAAALSISDEDAMRALREVQEELFGTG